MVLRMVCVTPVETIPPQHISHAYPFSTISSHCPAIISRCFFHCALLLSFVIKWKCLSPCDVVPFTGSSYRLLVLLCTKPHKTQTLRITPTHQDNGKSPRVHLEAVTMIEAWATRSDSLLFALAAAKVHRYSTRVSHYHI